MRRKFIALFFCAVLLASFAGCTQAEQSHPVGVYDGPCYMVNMEDHKIEELFDIIEGSRMNIFCSASDFNGGTLVNCADEAGGGAVGWHKNCFVYVPNCSSEDPGVSRDITTLLYYNKSAEAMPLEAALEYIPSMKYPD